MVQGWKQEEQKEFGVMEGFKWDFAPADAPWQNGVSEALVKSVKRAITAAIRDHVMKFSTSRRFERHQWVSKYCSVLMYVNSGLC